MADEVDRPVRGRGGTILDAAKPSGRAGRGGRTFHLKARSAGARGIGQLAGYARRERFDGRERAGADEDLESRGGRSAAELHTADALLERTGAPAWKRGSAYIIELPYELTAELRAAVMGALATEFENAGHWASWGVHSKNKHGQHQPHGHLVVASREGDDGGLVPPTSTAADLHALRQRVAGLVNAAADKGGVELEAPWIGGGFEQAGIDRPARQRIDTRIYEPWRRARERGEAVHPRDRSLAAAAQRQLQAHEEAVEEHGDRRRAEQRQAEAEREAAELKRQLEAAQEHQRQRAKKPKGHGGQGPKGPTPE